MRLAPELYTDSSDECYQLAMLALGLQHRTVTSLTTRESLRNTQNCARIPKAEAKIPG